MNRYFCFEPEGNSSSGGYCRYFHQPIEILKIERREDIKPFFHRLRQAKEKYYAAGFFSFELGSLLENSLPERRCPLPYAWMGIFKRMALYDIQKKKWLGERFNIPEKDCGYFIRNWKINTSASRYKKDIRHINRLIGEGEVYQVNYTCKIKFDFHGCPYSLYRELKKRQKASYNMLLRCGEHFIASFSPELFFKKDGRKITVKPMKGTAPRAKDAGEDRKIEKFLKGDKKNRSENLMIVDLMRNDLARISEKGTVKVKKLFEIEKYPTVHQMISTVSSTLKKNYSDRQLLESIFPSGSVTGAPKIRSMKMINEIEKESRGVYTGAMGYFLPGGKAMFNVAIRTVDIKGRRGEMGIGGGIVYDSEPESEYTEALLKGKFMTSSPAGNFKLIETVLFKNGVVRINFHLERLRRSAEFFNFFFNPVAAEKKIKEYSPGMKKCKLRITCDKKGRIKIQQLPFKHPEKIKISVSEEKTDPENIFLYHKTTCRPLYSRELEKARSKGLYDVVFFNRRDELSEGARSNIYIERAGRLYTPPLKCGLLNGTLRRKLLNEARVKEKIISPEDFRKADSVYISNAVLGLRKAEVLK